MNSFEYTYFNAFQKSGNFFLKNCEITIRKKKAKFGSRNDSTSMWDYQPMFVFLIADDLNVNFSFFLLIPYPQKYVIGVKF